MSKTIEQQVEEFTKDFTNCHPGDSGPGGNTPQDPVDEWACYPKDVRIWLTQALKERDRIAREEEQQKIRDIANIYSIPILKVGDEPQEGETIELSHREEMIHRAAYKLAMQHVVDALNKDNNTV